MAKEGGDDYWRTVIILNIPVKGGASFEEAINRGTAIIRGNALIVL